MEQVDVALARWAVGDGAAAINRACELLAAGNDTLAVATALRRDVDAARAAFALTAATARQRAVAAGVPGAEALVLTAEAQQQASAPVVAAWRARSLSRAAATLAPGEPVVDLCAGTGADATAIAATGTPVVAVERDEGRAVLLGHRAAVLGLDVEVVVADALSVPALLTGRVVHADPDRRDARGRRARRLAEHAPPVPALLAAGSHAGASRVAITVAPGLPWDDPDLPADAGVTFIEHEGRLVEALLVADDDVRARAVQLPEGHVRTRRGPVTTLPVVGVGAWLLLPSAAIVRARLHDEVGAELGARRLARHRALLTTDAAVVSPWLRAERVLATTAARPGAVRDWSRGSGEGQDLARDGGVEVVLHGLDVDPVRFVRAVGAPTGPHGVRVHLVRRDHDAVAVITAAPGR